MLNRRPRPAVSDRTGLPGPRHCPQDHRPALPRPGQARRPAALASLGWSGQDGRVSGLFRNVVASEGNSVVRQAALITVHSIKQAISGVSKVNPP